VKRESHGGGNPNFLIHLPAAFSYLPELQYDADLQRIWLSEYGLYSVDSTAMPNYDAATKAHQFKVPWVFSLRHPTWKPPFMTMVDFGFALFGLARAHPKIFKNGSFALKLKPLPERNLCDAARYKPIASSSFRTGNYDLAQFANDEDSTTRWISAWKGGDAGTPWIAVDLEAERPMHNVTVHWEASHPSKYDVEYSSDGSTWTKALEQEIDDAADWSSPHITTSLTGVTARWLRIRIKEPKGYVQDNKYPYSIWEIKVCATPPGQTTISTTSDPGTTAKTPSGGSSPSPPPTSSACVDDNAAFANEVGAGEECMYHKAACVTHEKMRQLCPATCCTCPGRRLQAGKCVEESRQFMTFEAVWPMDWSKYPTDLAGAIQAVKTGTALTAAQKTAYDPFQKSMALQTRTSVATILGLPQSETDGLCVHLFGDPGKVDMNNASNTCGSGLTVTESTTTATVSSSADGLGLMEEHCLTSALRLTTTATCHYTGRKEP
jgi:hypothetical protein